MVDELPIEILRQKFKSGSLELGVLVHSAVRLVGILKDVQSALSGTDILKIELEGDRLTQTFSSGVRMVWQVDDWGAPPSAVFARGSYETEETALMVALARGKNRFLDIGANVGWYSLHLAAALDPEDRLVYALEPIKVSFDVLNENIEINGLRDVIFAFNLAAGDIEGDQVFSVPIDVPGAASMLNLHPEAPSHEQICSVTTVDLFLAQQGAGPIDLVKCDVEGAELMVMRGASRLLTVDRPVILLEILRKWSRAFGYHPNDLIGLLGQYGYECWGIGKGTPRPILAVDEDTPETNYLFITDAHVDERAILQSSIIG